PACEERAIDLLHLRVRGEQRLLNGGGVRVEPFDARRDVLFSRRAFEQLTLERLVVRRGGPLAIAVGGEPLGHRDQQRLLLARYYREDGGEGVSDLGQLDVGSPVADHHAIPATSTAFVRPPA